MPLKIFIYLLGTYLTVMIPGISIGQKVQIFVDASQVQNRIPQQLHGACIEDVNHEIYGGIYDQRIFGESFEEPMGSPVIKGWKSFGGNWQAHGNSVSVNAREGFKLVKKLNLGRTYTATLRLKFGKRNDNAGIIVNVNNAKNGADAFSGYEISLDPNKKVLVFGKHRDNWTPLREVKLSIDFNDWIDLKVDVKGNKFLVFVNQFNTPVATLIDENDPLPKGDFGLRVYNADVTFRQLVLASNGKSSTIDFDGKPQLGVSGAWDAVQKGNAGSFALVNDAYNGKQSQALIHNGASGIVGVCNSGLNRWGIAIKKGNTYSGSIYLKATGVKDGITVSLQSTDGNKVYARQVIKNISSDWRSYTFALKASQNDKKAKFVFSISSKGKLLADQVALMCNQEQFKGLPIRADIGKAMQKEGLNFLRYGGTMVNAPEYRFKKMIGPRDLRPPYSGHWNPYSTNGFGIEDFLQFCEAAGFEAAFAINIEETPQDVADMVEYLKGSTNTKWGKQRATNGHPSPYKFRYIEIGNEEVIFHGDVKSEYNHYGERFNLLQSAMHAKDTSIKFICSAWWRPESPNMEGVFKAINGKAAYWDLHTDADLPNSGKKVDSSLTQMQAMFKKWDPNTSLKCTIFEENGGRHDLSRALGHAGTLNAVRRHGEFVLTSCAANALQPFNQNDNGWDQGQVFFTPSQVWGMPPYYAQQMAAENYLPLNVKTNVTGENIDVSATISEDGKKMVLHLVNPNQRKCEVLIHLKDFPNRKVDAKTTQLSGKLTDANTAAQPTFISPKINNVDLKGDSFKYVLPATSYIVFRFNS